MVDLYREILTWVSSHVAIGAISPLRTVRPTACRSSVCYVTHVQNASDPRGDGGWASNLSRSLAAATAANVAGVTPPASAGELWCAPMPAVSAPPRDQYAILVAACKSECKGKRASRSYSTGNFHMYCVRIVICIIGGSR